MKNLYKILVSTLFITTFGFGQAHPFFSEYAEGSSNHKYLEIYNGTGASVTLTNYQIAQAVNGGGWQYYHTFPSGSSIADGDVWVISTDGADSSIQAIADEVLSYPSVVHHNGDDARGFISISGTDTTWIDIIGDPDNDPGSGWDVAGVTDGTVGHTLVRKSTVTSGNTNWLTSAGTTTDNSEWVVLDQDTWHYVGSHPHYFFTESTLAGTWKMAPEAGALFVGPNPGDDSWWSFSADDLVIMACYFDDDYVFNADGSFNNVQGDETWLEYWQHLSDTNGDGSVDYDDSHCGAPVYPHDGSNPATWEYDGGAGTVTLNGVGAYLALPKVTNEGELTNEDLDVPESITYNITPSANNDTMTLAIEAGTGVFWTFKLVPVTTTPTNTHSLSFDGVDDYVEVLHDDLLNISENGGDQGTIMSWIKINDINNDSYNRIISKKSNWDDPDGYELEVNPGQNIITLTAGNQNYGRGSFISTNNWVHVAATFNDTAANFYLNGYDITIDSVIEAITSNSLPLYIGNVSGSAGDSLASGFDGLIDDVALYNIQLSQNEIQEIFSNGITVNENVVGYWNFNEGEGDTLTDQTANGNDGTIYGATWSADVPFAGTTTTSALTWSVQAQASLSTYNDNDNYLGVASNATNTFDAAYDEVEPPASPGSSISLYFPHAEWDYLLGDNFSTDARPEIALTDTMQVWDFEVVSTDAGDATLTFVFSDVPSVPVILENTATGARETLINNATYTFTAVADSAHPFRVSIGDTTAPALALGASCIGPAILISDSTHSLGWTSTDGFEVDSVLVSFSSDSGTTYSLQASLGTISGYDWTVPDAVVMTGGKLKVKSQDYAGNSVEKVSDYVFAIAGDSLSSAITAGWTLWGAPINPANDTMTTNLNDDFSNYWVTYDYVDNGYTYDG
ncbi:MAG TPA: LamG-like jellyroll fold domain-containing protein, partial [Candidatus Marinimicrobia bacterium]|nr:LamG-like jellyroll fold domain-containing protein [Candidatus Neomarinimicrobiota bacterium]